MKQQFFANRLWRGT